MTSSVLLGDDQRDIRDVARRFLQDRYPVDVVRAHLGGGAASAWPEICALGWPGIALAEARGGAGYGTVERCLVLEEAGRVLLPEPLLSSGVLAADAVAALPPGPAPDVLLERIVDGAVRATLVAAGDLLGAQDACGALREAGGLLHGDAGLVLDGDRAEVLVVAARREDGTTGLFELEGSATGVRIAPTALVDRTRGCAAITLDGASARPLADGDAAAALRAALDRGAVALAAELVGVARQAMDLTLAYLKERHQFGVAIGSFQALKHRMADLHVAVAAARELVYLAAETDDTGQAAARGMVAAAAKSAASDACVRAGGEAIQMHGGIGMTEEADPQLYYKRALVGAATLGSAVAQRERLAGILHG